MAVQNLVSSLPGDRYGVAAGGRRLAALKCWQSVAYSG
ncbi:hypothetical protein EC2845650_5281 [Escherichia coli 2845650]|nr:hypothetical protein EC2845650_5281 [Escherichia coli 2845650]